MCKECFSIAIILTNAALSFGILPQITTDTYFESFVTNNQQQQQKDKLLTAFVVFQDYSKYLRTASDYCLNILKGN